MGEAGGCGNGGIGVSATEAKPATGLLRDDRGIELGTAEREGRGARTNAGTRLSGWEG